MKISSKTLTSSGHTFQLYNLDKPCTTYSDVLVVEVLMKMFDKSSGNIVKSYMLAGLKEKTFDRSIAVC